MCEFLQLTNAAHSISLDQTRSLIKQSLRASIRRFMSQKADHDPPPPGPWPDRVSSRPSDEFPAREITSERQDGSHSKGGSQSGFVYNAIFDDFADPNKSNLPDREASETRSYSTSFPEPRGAAFPRSMSVQRDDVPVRPRLEALDPKKVFKPVEDYLVLCFSSHTCVNNSFATRRSSVGSRHVSEAARRRPPETRRQPRPVVPDEPPVSELDPKLLLLGDFAENGTWWTGGREETLVPKAPSKLREDQPSIVNSRSPRIDWGMVMEWYRTILNSAESWHSLYEEAAQHDAAEKLSSDSLQELEGILLGAQDNLQRLLLKCTEMLLKRPGRLMKEPQDVRFLLLILANPLLTPAPVSYSGQFQRPGKGKATTLRERELERHTPGRHSGIIKRVLGLLANSTEQCHQYLTVWLSKLPESLFLQTKELISSFVTYRLNRVSEKTIEPKFDMTGGLVPQMSNARSANTPANLHAALAGPRPSNRDKQLAEPRPSAYPDDWQIKAGAKVMSLVFAANNLTHVRRSDWVDGRTHGHLLTTSDFYNSLVDCLDFKEDFDMWESKTSKFTFCQYPFFLSIWAKIQILEHDAKRQMKGKAREAFFDSILTHKAYVQYLVLRIRRDCLVDDSLKQVSEVVGSGSEDIKKALRIEFHGEEGVDAGGLRKEWFLLLVREVFNPDHGTFLRPSPHEHVANDTRLVHL